MPEPGGTAAQSGLFYQNSVAALALADLLDWDPRAPSERSVEVRVEAPVDVDVVVRFADGHRDFQSVKLSVRQGNSGWPNVWQGLSAQQRRPSFGEGDRLTLVVAHRSRDSEAVAELCGRAATAQDARELRGRIAGKLRSVLDSIAGVLGSDAAAYEVAHVTSLRHLSMDEIERELGRRRLAGGRAPEPSVLPILRDIATEGGRRRRLFMAGPLRRRLKEEHQVVFPEPHEWGLKSYRETIERLARIKIPGTKIAGPADDLFVWPRMREYDRARPMGFEDEDPLLREWEEGTSPIDLKAFPNDTLDHIAVVAGPGFGKSALLTAIEGRLAAGPRVPVSIRLASLASPDRSVMAFLSDKIQDDFDVKPEWRLLAEQGLLVLLFDGLDEVPARKLPIFRRGTPERRGWSPCATPQF